MFYILSERIFLQELLLIDHSNKYIEVVGDYIQTILIAVIDRNETS